MNTAVSHESLIELPSRLRIEQRLGEISSNRLVQQDLIPRIARLGGQTMPTDEFLDTISERAEDAMLGMTVIAYAQVPKIINRLVEDDDQREVTMTEWAKRIEAKRVELGRDELKIAPHHLVKAHRKRSATQRPTHIQRSLRR